MRTAVILHLSATGDTYCAQGLCSPLAYRQSLTYVSTFLFYVRQIDDQRKWKWSSDSKQGLDHTLLKTGGSTCYTIELLKYWGGGWVKKIVV